MWVDGPLRRKFGERVGCVGGKGGFQIYTLGLDVGLQQKERLFVCPFVSLLV